MTSQVELQKGSIVDFDSPRIQRYNRIRHLKDRFASVGIAFGGISVIAAIMLIFLYLLYEVVPMFQSADVELAHSYPLTITPVSEILYLTVEEQNEVALQVTQSGEFRFHNLADGSLKTQVQLPLSEGVTVSSFAVNSDESRLMIFGLSDGTALIAKHQYRITYPDDKRVITPWVEYPYGKVPLEISQAGSQLQKISMRSEEERLLVVADDGTGLIGVDITVEEGFDDELSIETEPMVLPAIKGSVDQILIDAAQRLVFVTTGKKLHVIDISQGGHDEISLPNSVSDIRFLLGGISLLIADEKSFISQWFMVRDEEGKPYLRKIREFSSEGQGGAALAAEQRRKGFAAISSDGYIELFHSTAHRTVFSEKLLDKKAGHIALSPRANRLLVLTEDSQLHIYVVDNQHPEVSWYSLWDEVWYESYPEPDYIWQSSASNNDFEPKLSLTPLAFGTLKAAFYAMLLGAPLAIFGAIYTAYFMTPMMRRKIKPLVELMEALPTVILGFLAGLWLAPFMERHMTGVFTLLLVMPPAIVLFAYMMSRLPTAWQNTINEGWHGLILIPVVLIIGGVCFAISPTIELMLFNGDMRTWLTNDIGISFDQRNALVVGIAMGFAVIPTIFSIAEDAIFSVPKHLSYGSLALGATPWQTLVGVVLPTASPGIFSAMMIGMGRAVGETMIVLMATGNTPIMDANIFEGMRTLSANIAVEVPEAEVDSTHYRVLFLAAFVLFLFTFIVNTGAEMIRHNLRKKYGSL